MYTKTIYVNENPKPAAVEIGKEWLFCVSYIFNVKEKSQNKMMDSDGFVTVHPRFN